MWCDDHDCPRSHCAEWHDGSRRRHQGHDIPSSSDFKLLVLILTILCVLWMAYKVWVAYWATA